MRLARLFPNLDLPKPEKGNIILDAGSGPLTLPIALWLSRPDYRELPLRIICTDTSPRPMALGRAILESLAKVCHTDLLWEIDCRRVPIGKALRDMRQPVTLFTAGNVLNEIKPRGDITLMDRMGEVVESVGRVLARNGRALFVEPGTRFGGTLTANLRTVAVEAETGLMALSPCTHIEDCPLMGHKERGWCHMVQDAGAPLWLAALAGEAKLPKDSLALSFALLGAAEDDQGEPVSIQPAAMPLSETALYGRIISDAFRVPSMGFSRYACTGDGLALVGEAGGLPSGALVVLQAVAPPRYDAKSGAMIMRWVPDTTPSVRTQAQA